MEPETQSEFATALEGNAFIQIGLPISLAIIMAGVGLTLKMRDFHNVVYYPRALIAGTIAQIVLMPLLGFAVAYLFGMPAALAVGLVVIAACPGGTTSNVFTFLAKGNLALSILMTAIASLVTVITLPIITNIALDLFTEKVIEEPLRLPFGKTVITLVLIIFVPVFLGMAVRAKSPNVAGRLEGIVSAFGLFVLVALVAIIVYQTREHLLTLLVQTGPAVLALNLIGVGIGFGIGNLVRHDFADGLTLAVELGIKNSTIGMTLTLALLKSPEIAMPAAMYGLLMYVSAAGLVYFGRRHAHLRGIPAADEIPAHVPDDVGFPDDHPPSGA